MENLKKSIFLWIETPINSKTIFYFRVLVGISLLIKAVLALLEMQSGQASHSVFLIAGALTSLLLIFGAYVRLSSLIGAFAVGFLYFQSDSSAWRSHNSQLLFFCLVALAVESQSASSDPSKGLPGFRVLQCLIFIIYSSAVIVKLRPEFVSGLRMQQLYMLNYASSDAIKWQFFPLACQAVSLLTVLFEIAIPIGLLIARLRKYAVGVGILFHLVIGLVLPVSVFSLLMAALLLLFAPCSREKNIHVKKTA
jgi:hypothetical protein